MTRINAIRNIAGPRDSVAWGKTNTVATAIWGNINALAFAAVLIICSVAVGCSSEKPKPISSNTEIPVTQSQIPGAQMPAPVMQADNKPAPKKVVHKKPATVNYTDKTYGVAFEYPRRYAIETGNAATDLLTSSPVPMNFVQPGGVALAAVELPETGFANTDFSSAFFNVSVHKGLTADQCNQFAVPQPKVVAMTETNPELKSELKAEAKQEVPAQSNASSETKPAPTVAATEAQGSASTASTETAVTQTTSNQPAATESASSQSSASQPSSSPSGSKDSGSKDAIASSVQSQIDPQGSKLMLGDLELRATEAVSGEGTRQSDAKYFHLYQNGACYEFALNVTTDASDNGLVKHVDRDKVFSRLEKILDTVKINSIIPEVTAETPAPTPAPAGTPAQ